MYRRGTGDMVSRRCFSAQGMMMMGKADGKE